MIERRFGRIVNVASIAALRARPMSIAYSVSKAGMVALTKSLAEAVAGFNVRVNAVAPGLIDTEILEGVSSEQINDLVQATPLKRIGQPDDIAQLVLFLLSERSRFMTGQTLVATLDMIELAKEVDVPCWRPAMETSTSSSRSSGTPTAWRSRSTV